MNKKRKMSFSQNKHVLTIKLPSPRHLPTIPVNLKPAAVVPCRDGVREEAVDAAVVVQGRDLHQGRSHAPFRRDADGRL